MNRSQKSLLTLAALPLVALALATCTVDNGSALSIIQNQVPTTEMGGCSIPADMGMSRLTHGTLDVALDMNYPYWVYPLLASHFPPLAMTGNEPNTVNITSFEVKIDPPPGITVPWSAQCPAQYDYPTQGHLAPGDFAAFRIQGLRDCHAGLLKAMFQSGALPSDLSQWVDFRITLHAKGRHGGTEIKSDPMEYPVRVCYGCLQTGYSDPAFSDFRFPNVPSCDRLEANPYTGNPCNIAQDFGPVLCCARDALGKDLVCPAVGKGTPSK